MSSLSAEFGPGIGCFATRLARTMPVASTRPLCSPEALAELVVSTLVPLPFLRKEGATRTAAWLSKQSKQRSNRGFRRSEIEACRMKHLKRAGRNQCNRARRTRHPISQAAKGTKGYHCQTRLAVCRHQMPRIFFHQRKLAALEASKKSLLHQAFAGPLTQDEKSSTREAATHD